MVKSLDRETFAHIVEHTPLIAIDLIIKDSKGRVLLGRRVNAPAKDYWFVPGGRIYKNETISKAFSRIFFTETGHELLIDNARFLGVYEHFYENSFYDENISTHYVVLGYEVNYDFSIDILPETQHNTYKIVPVKTLIQDAKVHSNVKLYFKESE